MKPMLLTFYVPHRFTMEDSSPRKVSLFIDPTQIISVGSSWVDFGKECRYTEIIMSEEFRDAFSHLMINAEKNGLQDSICARTFVVLGTRKEIVEKWECCMK